MANFGFHNFLYLPSLSGYLVAEGWNHPALRYGVVSGGIWNNACFFGGAWGTPGNLSGGGIGRVSHKRAVEARASDDVVRAVLVGGVQDFSPPEV